MSTVKITELSQINYLNSNTANTLLVGVDIPSNITGKITATTLAQGLYANNVLNVGNSAIVLPNTIAQFALSSNNYSQTNFQNPYSLHPYPQDRKNDRHCHRRLPTGTSDTILSEKIRR